MLSTLGQQTTTVMSAVLVCSVQPCWCFISLWKSDQAALHGCRCADFVLLNKIDMLKEGDLEGLSQIAASLNPLAKVTSTS